MKAYLSYVLACVFILALSFATATSLSTALTTNQAAQAVSANDTSYSVNVLTLKYFPLTADGQNIDINVTGDVGDPYAAIRQKTIDVNNNLLTSIPTATKYTGYSNTTAPAALTYQLIDTKEFTQAVPMDSVTRRPSYGQIMADQNICNYVDVQGVREVWMWAYQGPNQADNIPYLNISESKMSGPFGDISNSPRFNDMPVCNNTYRVYTFNYGRGTYEALESWGHQVESELSAIDTDLFRNKWQGPAYPQASSVTGRCGSVHNPPNARYEYDRGNSIPTNSDCLTWNPDSVGTLSPISCLNWGCSYVSDANNAELNYMVWNWQNLPGRNNTKTFQGNPLRNWWDVHGNFDGVMGTDRTLAIPVPVVKAAQPTVNDTFTRANSATTLGTSTSGHVWTATKGTWGISGNQAYSVDPCPAPGYAVVDSHMSDGEIQVTMAVNHQDMRLPFRYVDLNNLYWVENTGTQYVIDKVVAGTRSRIAYDPFLTPKDGDTIRIQMNGPSIKVFVNDILRLAASDSSLSSTKHGLGTWCNSLLRFDNYTITSIDMVAPAVSITSPTNGAILAKNKTTTIKAQATDAKGIAHVDFFVNNVLQCTTTVAPYQCNWLVPNHSGSVTYTLKATAYDTSNNATSSSISVIGR